MRPVLVAVLILTSTAIAAPPPPPKVLHPTVRQAVASVSEARIADIIRHLEGFGTRHTLSSADHPTRGIGAARRWIVEQFKSYSPRLEVRFDSHRVKAQGRISRDVEVVNVVAVLPGRTSRQVLVTCHYDSLNLGGRSEATTDPEEIARQVELPAPGASDNASGTAAVMEMARILSRYDFENTLVFISFAGEEQMLIGSTLYAAAAQFRSDNILAVLNSDVIGDEKPGTGRGEPYAVRLFSGDPPDSPSRALARYFKSAALRYVPSLRVDLVFRPDRFGRGGDHTPFDLEGFAAVRLTTPNENYSNQHTAADKLANLSVPYVARVTRAKAAVAASLALAPAPPRMSGSGAVTRGDSKYDAVIRWWSEDDSRTVAGYSVVWRATTAPDWEHEAWAGDVRDFRLPNLSIDDKVFGVKAIGTNGVESLVSTYTPSAPRKQTIETY